MSAPALIAFYYVTAIESWTYINIIEYYHAKIEQKDLKQILDCVKSLMTGSNNDFDIAIELFYFGAAPSIVDIADYVVLQLLLLSI
ncbi:6268_t:CDS:2 [Entrophospora sp. SA101]|nr:6268_t:CDS:2 [Entrophospora sp. SA101]